MMISLLSLHLSRNAEQKETEELARLEFTSSKLL